MSTDKVCGQAADAGIKIKVTELEDEYLLIEGTSEAFLFLSKLFAAHAEQGSDCGSQMSPFGAGKALFKRGSTKGLYLHRVDKDVSVQTRNFTHVCEKPGKEKMLPAADNRGSGRGEI